MLLQRQTISRKTPNDGMLEITAETAERVSGAGGGLRVTTPAEEAPASVRTLTCTCGKRGDGTHLHYFLESPVLRALVPGEEVALELDEPDLVRISPIAALPPS